MITIEIPNVPEGYEKTDEIRRPKSGADELCWVYGAGEPLGRWANSEWGAFERNPDLCGPIATRKEIQIDMSRMVGQYCEFGDVGDIGKLISVGKYCTYIGGAAGICAPIYGHTYAHTGGGCPVPEGFEYEVTTGGGEKSIHTSTSMAEINPHRWTHMCNSRDDRIIFVRFIKVLEGYKL